MHDQSDNGNADKDKGRHRERHDNLRSEGVGVGDEAQHVAEQQEHKQCENEREIGAPVIAHIAPHHIGNEFIHHLGGALKATRHHLALRHGDGEECPANDHRQQHEEAGVGKGDVVTTGGKLNEPLDFELLYR